MKYSFVLFLSILFLGAQSQDTTFTLSGKFEKLKSGKVYLTYYQDSKQHRDSVMLDKGKFTFTGSIPEPVQASLTVPDKRGDYLQFYLEPKKIKISGDGDSLKLLTVSGSPVNDDSWKLKELLKPVSEWEEKNSKIYDQAMKDKNKPLMDSLDEVDLEVLKKKREVITQFVKLYPSSMRAALAIRENYSYYAEAEDLEKPYMLLTQEVKLSKLGMSLWKMLETYRTVAIGKIAPDFTQTTPEGKELALSSQRGKYVLVDFWASWCGPCRRENPNVVNIYNDYKNKNFTIFGVSYDTKKERWEKAITDDKLTWEHVSDLKGWQNSTSEQYGIKAIPSNMIIDKNGVIVAKNLFGKKLREKVAELLN